MELTALQLKALELLVLEVENNLQKLKKDLADLELGAAMREVQEMVLNDLADFETRWLNEVFPKKQAELREDIDREGQRLARLNLALREARMESSEN